MDEALTNAGVKKVSHKWALERVNQLRNGGLLTYNLDVADLSMQPLDETAFDEEWNRVKDHRTPRQRRKRDEPNET